MSGGSITVQPDALAEGKVIVRTDRPGERATSAVIDGRELIAQIEQALGITHDTDEPEEEAPAL